MIRCYTKGTDNFSAGLKQHMVSCQLDGLEMVPLNYGSLLYHGNDFPAPHGICEQVDVVREQMQVKLDLTSSQSSDSGTRQEEPDAGYSKGEPKSQH